MSRLTNLCLILLLAFIGMGCNEEEDPPTLSTLDFVQSISAIDFLNNENAGDLVILFRVETPETADKLDIFIAKSTSFSSTSTEDLLNLPNSSLHNVRLSGKTYEVSLPAEMKDIDGDPVQNDVEYTIGVLIGKEGNRFLNEENEKIKLTNQHYLTGDYTGTWDDNLYTGFGISAKIMISPSNRGTGEFFYSNSFSSCCGGTNDGRIIFQLTDGGEILDFRYDQTLDSFQGGVCTGLYTGSGTLEKYTTLKIDFSGEDCEGPHTGGKIVLQKQSN